MHFSLNIENRSVEFDMHVDNNFVSDYNTMTVHQKLGACEPEVCRLMARVLKEGDTAVDVGANVGYFTLLMAKLVGPAGHVAAFEPAPANVYKLQANLDLNCQHNVALTKHPLTDRHGPVSFYLASDSGLSSLAPNEFTTATLLLQGNVLDFYCRDLHPRLIKIDVEGAEEHVLRGAEAVLDRGVPFITCEINARALERMERSIPSLRTYMEDKGYSTFILHGSGALPTYVPPMSRIIPQLNCSNILFSSIVDVGVAWPEVVV